MLLTFNFLLGTEKIIFMILPPPPIDINSVFLNPTDEIEIKNIILSLNPSKAIGPNSIRTKILKLLINDISSQLTELFNLSFSFNIKN